jgi:hypothetical protein
MTIREPTARVPTTAVTASTAVPSPSTPTPTATAAAAAVQLPAPGGTCDASQFVAGTPSSTFDFSTFVSRVAEAVQPLTNVGDECVLSVPKTIAMAATTGSFVAIALPNAGDDVCVNDACKYIYPESYKVPSGAAVQIMLRVWWPSDPNSATTPPALCARPIADATRAVFPFASGEVAFSWDIPFHQVCPLAGSIGIGLVASLPTPDVKVLCTPWPIHKGLFIETLTCEAAVNAALGALPSGHRTITSIVVQLGRYCPTIDTCPEDLNLITGYVSMTFDAAPALLMTVRGDGQSPVVVIKTGPLPTLGPTG